MLRREERALMTLGNEGKAYLCIRLCQIKIAERKEPLPPIIKNGFIFELVAQNNVRMASLDSGEVVVS